LAAVLEQHLGRTDKVGGRRCNGYDVELAGVAAIRPFNGILASALDGQGCRPGSKRFACGPGQLLRLAVDRADLDRRRALAVRTPQLKLGGVSDAHLATG